MHKMSDIMRAWYYDPDNGGPVVDVGDERFKIIQGTGNRPTVAENIANHDSVVRDDDAREFTIDDAIDGDSELDYEEYLKMMELTDD